MSLYRDALLIRGHAGERHASAHRVLGPALVAIAAGALHELGEGQRPYSNLVPAAPELRHDVMREELRVAPVTHTSTFLMRRSPLSLLRYWSCPISTRTSSWFPSRFY